MRKIDVHKKAEMRNLGKRLLLTVFLSLPFIFYGIPHWLRPSGNESRSLFQGIDYRREVRSVPRPLVIHTVAIDLTAPGIEVLVTPGNAADNTETNAKTTSEFLQAFKLQLAVNANFFWYFREKTPWDYFPKSGDRVNTVGQSISNGVSYSEAELDWSVLCFSSTHRASIVSEGMCPIGTRQAVAGSTTLVDKGEFLETRQDTADSDGLYSRTVVAVDRSGERLWIIAVDDKQPLYSEGVTLAEMTDLVMELGAYTAVNLDGGGSTTLVSEMRSGVRVLNAPIHTKIPMRERPVANHLGFYAKPLSTLRTAP
jgi:Phosphodiester glycosidase